MRTLNIKIIGVGGIGTILSDKISRFLNYKNGHDGFKSTITLLDGDEFEEKNEERQEFINLGNKASVKSRELKLKYPNVDFQARQDYVNDKNISSHINNGDIVFVAVDNHKSRKIVADYVRTLSDIIVISGGNELTDGNVQIYIRKGGKNLTPNLTDHHPEINNPDDKLPEELSCEELESSEPQLFFTNLGVAAYMCFAFYNVIVKEKTKISEVYFDMLTMCADAKIRAPLF